MCVAGLTGPDVVTCSRKVLIKPDADLAEAVQNGPYDAVVMPGGLQGATTLAKVFASTIADINVLYLAAYSLILSLESDQIAATNSLSSFHPSVCHTKMGQSH